jgi:hypothetical protein
LVVERGARRRVETLVECGVGVRFVVLRPLDVRAGQAGGDLGGVQGPEHPQQVGDALDALHAAGRIQALRLALELRDDVRIEQLPHLDAPEKLGEQRGVDRQSGRAPLGKGRVALVHEGADVSEQQVAGKR